MFEKLKNCFSLSKAVIVIFSFLIVITSYGQSFEEDAIDISREPTYYSLSKALRNPEKVYKLYLKNQGLQEFPLDILKFKELRVLFLDSNQISVVPSQIGELKKLYCLSLSQNILKELPATIGELTELQYLYLEQNKLASLPPEFYRLSKLQELFIHENNLTELSPEIKVMQKLKKLYAYKNLFGAIPDEIGHLYNLEILSLHGNRIKKLPLHFYELMNLRYLYLGSNELNIIDPLIGKMSSLEVLDLENNKLENLPEELSEIYGLQKLYLGINPLKGIPEKYNRLMNLKKLDLKDLIFQPFPQVLYDLDNLGVKITGLKTKELYQTKLLLSQGRNKKLLENYMEAIPKYEAFIKIDTNNVEAISELASCYLETSQYDKAADLCKRGLSKNTSQELFSALRTTYSNSLRKTNKYDEILKVYDQKIKDDSVNASAYFEKGLFFFDQKKYEEAKDLFFKTVKINPSYSDAHFYLAVIFLIQENKNLFILSSLRLFELSPKSRRTQTTMPFFLTRMNMKSGFDNNSKKKSSTYYIDSYIIRNELNEIVYKSESPQTDLFIAMAFDLTRSGKFTIDTANSSKGIDAKKIAEEVFNTNKTNVEIFQIELDKICKTPLDSIKPEERVIWEYYNPYYTAIKNNGHLETYSYLINQARGNNPDVEVWIKENRPKIENFNLWNKGYKWVK